MKQTKTYCDACGDEIKKGYGVDHGCLELIGQSKDNSTHKKRITWNELCHTCTTKLFNLLNKFAEAKRK